ncbi:MAG TPA: glycosyltransferase [Gemmataceae bacterium]|nr:glycosyltransferase [Gemmataceae bacterium]
MHDEPMRDAGGDPLLLVTSMYSEGDLARRLGRDAYSYRYVYRAFAPLLQRWGQHREASGPRGVLEHAVAEARRRHCQPIHLSFLPLHLMDVAPNVPNVAVPAWEFPDIPAFDLENDPRQNWARRAEQVDLIITHTQFSRAAFVRAGVRTPVHVVPVPAPADYFQTPDWQPGQRAILGCPCYVFPQPAALPRPPRPWVNCETGHLPARPSLRQLYKKCVKAMPQRFGKAMYRSARAVRAALWSARQVFKEADIRELYPPRSNLELSGVVYTTILNPFDSRKNWQDLLSGYLLALKDRDDATLVVKLVVSSDWEAAALAEMFAFYRNTGLSHRCKLAFVTAYLSEEQLVELTRASTYYVNTSRAEGSCLPLQNFMAAGRPALAPPHTGMADSIDDQCGFTLESHPEPAPWPQEVGGGYRTTWHRLVWQSLHDRLRASYEAAKDQRGHYQTLAERARERMRGLAGAESVWPRLAAALDSVRSLKFSRDPKGSADNPALPFGSRLNVSKRAI